MNKDEFNKKLLRNFFKDNKLKMIILVELGKNNCSRKQLLEFTRCSPALLAYHLHGNAYNEGLLDWGLINKQFNDPNKKTDFYYSISDLGREILNEVGVVNEASNSA